MERQQTRPGSGHAARRDVTMGITAKLLLSILVPLVLILTAIGVILGVQTSGTVEELVREELTAQAQAASGEVKSYFQTYFGLAEGLAESQAVRDGLSGRSAGGLRGWEGYQELLQTLRRTQEDNSENVMFVWVTKFDTGELLQNDETLLSPPSFTYETREWYTQLMNRGGQETAISGAYTDADNGKLVVTVAAPVVVDGRLVGVVGVDVGLENLQTALGGITIGQNGYITLIDVNDTVIYHPDRSVVNVSIDEANYSQNMHDALAGHQSVQGVRYTRGSDTYYGSTEYLEDLGYQVLGILPEEEFTAHIASAVRTLVVGFIVCALLLAAICTLVAVSITRPLKRLRAVAAQLADGELQVEYQVQGHDEVSAVGRHTLRIVERLKEYIRYIDEIAHVLDQIGAGNLVFTLKCDYEGEFARLKEALLRIQASLSETMVGIAQAADQVNAGADQIASGAQALAQGATEQASSVEELSASVQELSNQASEGAEHAMDASRHLDLIRDEITKSNEHMRDMLEAMEDITRQSGAIGKIIKTIDDIAFQTNILALNAAVEAARAGSAGKGFAVVADEVRSLASKSADAAKETNDLIASSIQAVRRGEEIARLTAESLSNAVTGAVEVVRTIDLVSEDYQAQARRLSEISSGVDQISNVVQTNSATAEQSAAASEELAGQAGSMQQQVARFHVADGPERERTGEGEELPPAREQLPLGGYHETFEKY